MKPMVLAIIELSKNNYKPEAHAMNKSITQATQNDKQISKSIKRFFISHPESYNPIKPDKFSFFKLTTVFSS